MLFFSIFFLSFFISCKKKYRVLFFSHCILFCLFSAFWGFPGSGLPTFFQVTHVTHSRPFPQLFPLFVSWRRFPWPDRRENVAQSWPLRLNAAPWRPDHKKAPRRWPGGVSSPSQGSFRLWGVCLSIQTMKTRQHRACHRCGKPLSPSQFFPSRQDMRCRSRAA